MIRKFLKNWVFPVFGLSFTKITEFFENWVFRFCTKNKPAMYQNLLKTQWTGTSLVVLSIKVMLQNKACHTYTIRREACWWWLFAVKIELVFDPGVSGSFLLDPLETDLFPQLAAARRVVWKFVLETGQQQWHQVGAIRIGCWPIQQQVTSCQGHLCKTITDL